MSIEIRSGACSLGFKRLQIPCHLAKYHPNTDIQFSIENQKIRLCQKTILQQFPWLYIYRIISICNQTQMVICKQYPSQIGADGIISVMLYTQFPLSLPLQVRLPQAHCVLVDVWRKIAHRHYSSPPTH